MLLQKPKFVSKSKVRHDAPLLAIGVYSHPCEGPKCAQDAIAGVLLQWSVVWMFILSGASVVLVSGLAALHRPVREIQ